MIDKDYVLLERAYMSISKPAQTTPTNFKKKIDVEHLDTVDGDEEIVSAGPIDEPAPGVDMEMIGDDKPDISAPLQITPPIHNHDSSEMSAMVIDDQTLEDEQEEDEMAIDNLNSIRESILKIAIHCSAGGHLGTWQQQKLAIAMDNLASVARSLRQKDCCI